VKVKFNSDNLCTNKKKECNRPTSINTIRTTFTVSNQFRDIDFTFVLAVSDDDEKDEEIQYFTAHEVN
jgi:hypothetical protein